MPATYETFGPYILEESDSQTFKRSLRQLWKDCDSDNVDLCSAVGVYIWAVKKAQTSLPWNVGRTDSQGFQSRFRQKEMDLRRLRDKEKEGEIEIYLLALRTPGGAFRKPVAKGKRLAINNWLETVLIASALRVNPELRNRSKSKYLRTTKVDGFLNDDPKKRSTSAAGLNALLTTQI